MAKVFIDRTILRVWLIPIALFFMVAIGSWQFGRVETPPVMSELPSVGTQALADEPIRPIPLRVELNPRKVTLGEKLFHDRQLSGDNTKSCASCHNLALGGTDGLTVSIGIDGNVGEINSPTIFNSSLNFKQFWDGRAETLEEQIEGPTNSLRELGSTWPDIIEKLKQSEEYQMLFATIYDDGITRENIKNAIATFERSLITPNSRFDRFLRGDRYAITTEEKRGYALFKSYGCASCHQGVNVGGNMFQKLGIFEDYFEKKENLSPVDLGRYNVTQDPRDRYTFKVPTLRNIAETAPYLHDGSAKTLEGAIQVMAKYQLGRQLSPDDTEAIVRFLHTLTGEYKGKLVSSEGE
ncbi:MAG: cytochrome-c peroxidase [Cyanobacteriota bacterium]|nr:cytochrome-c peroxidase [Cyanobacteriota bacterium]